MSTFKITITDKNHRTSDRIIEARNPGIALLLVADSENINFDDIFSIFVSNINI